MRSRNPSGYRPGNFMAGHRRHKSASANRSAHDGRKPARNAEPAAGILKLPLRWSGSERLSQAVSAVPGYRVGILGEDLRTVQIRVVRSA